VTQCNNNLWGAWSAHAMLLPYMEQVPVYNGMNFYCETQNNSTGGQAQNITMIAAKINTLLCPSSPEPPANAFFPNGTTYNGVTYHVPGNCYFFSTGSSLMWRGDTGATFGGSPCIPNGPFNVGGGAIGIRDVLDGTSNTVMAGEWRIGDYNDAKNSIQDIVGNQNYSDWGATSRDLIAPTANMPAGAGGVNIALSQCAQTWQSRSGSFGTGGQRSWNGRSWNIGLYGYTLGNIVVPPNSQYPYCEFWSTNSDWDAGGFIGLTSYHSGGANIMMADGSVRFLKSSVSYPTLWAIGSMNQGETVSADSY
jgi:prepilin-type processing-associated H-X9-DG protein